MYADEEAIAAAQRGVREELGERSSDLTSDDALQALLLHTTVEVKPSASFPNLMSRYTFYEVQLRVPGLPTGSFKTNEVQDGGKAVTHFWEWRDAMIQPRHGLRLSPEQTRLLERLFPGCARVDAQVRAPPFTLSPPMGAAYAHPDGVESTSPTPPRSTHLPSSPQWTHLPNRPPCHTAHGSCCTAASPRP